LVLGTLNEDPPSKTIPVRLVLGQQTGLRQTPADKIALELGQYFVDQGWIPPEALKKPLF